MLSMEKLLPQNDQGLKKRMAENEKGWSDKVEEGIKDIKETFKRAKETMPNQGELYSYKEMYWIVVMLMEKTGKVTEQRAMEELQACFETKTIEELVVRATKSFSDLIENDRPTTGLDTDLISFLEDINQ